jgi:cardiolipin synthase
MTTWQSGLMSHHRGWLGRLLTAAVLAVASGCTSLPIMVPDMGRRLAAPVQLDGSHGPLSPEQSRKILLSLARGGEDSHIFDRHLALEAHIAGSPLVVGNKVLLMQDGPETYQRMLAAIGGATRHINMETYIIEDDEIGNRFADLLIAKQSQGVAVNLIYDSVGSIGTPTRFFKRLADAGIGLVEFNPVNPLTAGRHWEVNQRDHRKLLIVDGKVAFVGGINISSVYSGGSYRRTPRRTANDSVPWRDTHLQMEGPVVAEVQKLFLATWAKQGGAPLADVGYYPPLAPKGTEVVRAVGSSPDEPYSLIYVTLMSAINSAETKVYLTNAYFVPDPQLLEARKGAVARGVDVKLLLPSRTDSWLVFNAGRAYYSELLAAGVQIFERRDALLHSKTAMIDGVWSTVGSTNLDWRSFVHNEEINAVILGQGFGAQMLAVFEADLSRSHRITLDQWEQRPLSDRVKETFARMWGYWL